MLEKFIKKQRTRQNMTQEYLASELSISRPTYIQIEQGKRELTVTEAKKLAAIFNMTLDDFWENYKIPDKALFENISELIFSLNGFTAL